MTVYKFLLKCFDKLMWIVIIDTVILLVQIFNIHNIRSIYFICQLVIFQNFLVKKQKISEKKKKTLRTRLITIHMYTSSAYPSLDMTSSRVALVIQASSHLNH